MVVVVYHSVYGGHMIFVGDENKKQLLDLGAMEHVLHLMQSEDKIVRRNSCMVTGVMTGHRKFSIASDFFQDWWAEVTHGAKNGGPFSEIMGPSISN